MLWDGRVHRLKSLKGVRARIQETGATDVRDVPVTELRGLPSRKRLVKSPFSAPALVEGCA